MFEPILVTYQEYCAIGFSLSLLGMFYTATQMFPFPDEVEG